MVLERLGRVRGSFHGIEALALFLLVAFAWYYKDPDHWPILWEHTLGLQGYR